MPQTPYNGPLSQEEIRRVEKPTAPKRGLQSPRDVIPQKRNLRLMNIRHFRPCEWGNERKAGPRDPRFYLCGPPLPEDSSEQIKAAPRRPKR